MNNASKSRLGEKVLLLLLLVTNVFLCNLITIYVPASVFGFSISKETLWILAASAALAVLLCASEKRRALGIGIFMFVAAVVVVLHIDKLTIDENMLECFVAFLTGEAESLREAAPVAEAFLMLYGVVGCLVLAVAYATKKNYSVWVIISAVELYFSIVVGRLPSAAALVSWALMMLYLRLSVVFLETEDRRVLLYEPLALVGLIVLGTVLPLVVTHRQYEESVENGRVRAFVRNINENGLNRLIEGITGRSDRDISLGVTGGKLSDGRVRITGKTQLVVALPKNSPQTYLRAYVGTEFSRDQWIYDEEDIADYMEIFGLKGSGFNSASYSFSLLSRLFYHADDARTERCRFPLYYASMTIMNKRAAKDYLYTPYCSMAEEGFSAESDGTWNSPARGERYFSSYIYNEQGLPNAAAFSELVTLRRSDFPAESGEMDAFFSYNERYTRFAERMYLGVPMSYRNALKDAVLRSGSLSEKIAHVQKYMTANYTYTLDPPANKSEKEQLLYFIEDSRQGYCQYYASVAVMLFRMMDVPARYVEGYVVPRKLIAGAGTTQKAQVAVWDADGVRNVETDFVTVEVSDQYAHAWAEIWIEGYGWYPIEVTYGYTDAVPLDYLEREFGQGNNEPITPSPGLTPGVGVTGPALPTKKPVPSIAPTKKPVQPTGAPVETDTNRRKRSPVLLIGAVVLLVLVLIVPVRYRILTLRRNRRISSSDSRTAAIAVYRELLRIGEEMGVTRRSSEADREFHARLIEALPSFGEELNGMVSIAVTEKAVFAKEGISREEFRLLHKYYRELRRAVLSKLRGIRRLKARYWKVL